MKLVAVCLAGSDCHCRLEARWSTVHTYTPSGRNLLARALLFDGPGYALVSMRMQALGRGVHVVATVPARLARTRLWRSLEVAARTRGLLRSATA